MLKKILKITAASMCLLATGVFAQTVQPAQLDVIIRDFPSSAPGFQVGGAGAGGCALDQMNTSYAKGERPTKNMVQQDLFYDKTGCPAGDIMGVEGDPDHIRYRYCAYPKAGTANCANSLTWIETWFDERRAFDNAGNKANNGKGKIVDIMELKMNSASGLFEIIYVDDQAVATYVGSTLTSENWNGIGKDGGYFPLDKYSSPEFGNLTDSNGVRNMDKVYGLENCSNDKDNDRWKQIYPYTPTCVGTAYNHNYGFSMAGTGTFKYKRGGMTGTKSDVFEFVGDDDMWIFIDGKLEADIGGLHEAAGFRITMDNLATTYGWAEGSTHTVNFFYMDRQTTGSNMVLKMSLSDLSPARFGSPRILEAKTVQSQDGGAGSTTIYVSSDLNLETMRQHIGAGTFPIVVHKSKSTDILGYQLESIDAAGTDGSKGYMYIINGKVCSVPDCSSTQILNSGDSLSFNVKTGDMEGFTDNGFGLTATQDNLYIKSKSNVPANKLAWAKNSTTIPPLELENIPGDPSPPKPPFDMDSWFSGKGSVGNITTNPKQNIPPALEQGAGNGRGKDANGVDGFGSKGSTVPANKAGELQLTVYPNASVNGGKPADEKAFGLPPKAEAGSPFGVADPTSTEDGGGYMFVKNGFANESSVGAVQIAPARCTRQGDANSPQINCLNFSMQVKQPFKLAVTVYDQLGNFVTQYREEVTESEFRRAVQAPGFYADYGTSEANPTVSESDECAVPDPTKAEGAGSFGDKNTLTTNGVMKASVNIYPFSAEGRRFGNGVYLLKVDRVDMPYEGCMNLGGAADFSTSNFNRSHSDEKFGYMRVESK